MSDEGRLEVARARFVAGASSDALAMARASLDAARAAGDVAAMGRARMLCADVAYDRLRYGEARDELRHAISELAPHVGPDDDDVRQAHASLGLVLHSLDDIGGAKDELALAEARLSLPESSSSSAIGRMRAGLWLTIAVLHEAFGGAARARTILERLLEIVPRSDEALLATTHMHLSTVLQGAGAIEEAIAHEEQCIDIRTSLWGPANPRVVAARFGLVQLFLADGRVDAARGAGREAMALLEATGQHREPRASTAYAALGVAELMSGDVHAATKHLERAGALEEKTFGASNPHTAHMLVMLAEVLASQKNWGKVMGLCKRILPALRDSARWAGAYLSACGLDCTAHTVLGRAPEGARRLRDALTSFERRGGRTFPPSLEATDGELEVNAKLAGLWLLLGRTELAMGRQSSGVQALERARHLASEGGASDVLAGAAHDLEHVRGGGRLGLKGSA